MSRRTLKVEASHSRYFQTECVQVFDSDLVKAAGASTSGLANLQKVKRAVSCIVRAVADVSWPKLAEPRVVTNVPKLV